MDLDHKNGFKSGISNQVMKQARILLKQIKTRMDKAQKYQINIER